VDAPSEWGNPWMAFGGVAVGGRVRRRVRGRVRGRERGMPGGCEAGMPTHEGRGRGMSVGGRCTYRASVRVCVGAAAASSVKHPASSKRPASSVKQGQGPNGHGVDMERTRSGHGGDSGHGVDRQWSEWTTGRGRGRRTSSRCGQKASIARALADCDTHAHSRAASRQVT
jgi:hypothetical protein